MDSLIDVKSIKKEMEILLKYLSTSFKNRMKCQVTQNESGYYSKINILHNDENSVSNFIYSSTSIIKYSDHSNSNGYEKKLINELQNLDDEEQWILNIFYYIENLPERECHYIIAKYFINENDEVIMKTLSIKKRTLAAIKANSLLHLGLLVPGGLVIFH